MKTLLRCAAPAFALLLAGGAFAAEPTKKPAKKEPTNFEKTVAACASGEIPASPAKADGLEALKGWRAARWADLALCRQFTVKKTKRTILYLATGGGKKGKAAAGRGHELVLAEKGALKLCVYNRGAAPVKVSVALWIGKRPTHYYETPAREVAVGKWQKLSFDLAAKDYKSAASRWKYSAGLGKERRLQRLSVLLYHGNKASRVLIDGLTVDGKPVPKRKPSAKKKPEPKPEPKKAPPKKAEGEKEPE